MAVNDEQQLRISLEALGNRLQNLPPDAPLTERQELTRETFQTAARLQSILVPQLGRSHPDTRALMTVTQDLRSQLGNVRAQLRDRVQPRPGQSPESFITETTFEPTSLPERQRTPARQPGDPDFGPPPPSGQQPSGQTPPPTGGPTQGTPPSQATPNQQAPTDGGGGTPDEFTEFLDFLEQNNPDLFSEVAPLLQGQRPEPIGIPEVGTDRVMTGFRLPEDDLGTPREQIEREFLDRSLRSLRGELPVSPALMRDLQQREELLEERIRRQFGPGGETASPAIEMRREFEEGRALTLEEARRQDLAMSEQLGTQRQLSRQQALQDFLGNVERVQGFGQQLEQPLTQLTTGQAQIPFTQLGGIQTALQTLGVPGTPQDVSATASLPLQAFAQQRGQQFAGNQQQNQFAQGLLGNLIGVGTFAAGGGFS